MIRKWGVLSVMILHFYSLSAQIDSVHYSVFINPAMQPGFLLGFNQRIYLIKDNQVKVLVENGKGTYPSYKNMFKGDSVKTDPNERLEYAYDTTSFSLTKNDKRLVIHTLESMKCLAEFMDNPGVVDGLRWFVVCEVGKKSYSTYIGNMYHDKIAIFVGIINKYVPKQWYLWYENELPLITYTEDCD